MVYTAERLALKAAIAIQDWTTAAQIVRANPSQFGTPPVGVSDELAALVSEPTDVGWMIVEWNTQANSCPPGQSGCKPYLLSAEQFDHLNASATQAEADAWFAGYVANRQANAPMRDQLGTTLFLCKVNQIAPIVDFHGVVV